MRGAVLLVVDRPGPRAQYADHFRANELRVYEAEGTEDALKHLDEMTPDVIVTDFTLDDGPTMIQELRRRADHATSIIVVSAPDHQELVRTAGADCLVPETVRPADILYEIHRALIMRRSGRRLPGNWQRNRK
jgi:DNA-binding response OmpR family regulator